MEKRELELLNFGCFILMENMCNAFLKPKKFACK